MNDLIRPPLYGAYQRVQAIKPRRGKILAEVVGPICESTDFFAQKRTLPKLMPKDLLAILDAGAYGFSMASHYNSRPKVPEVLVEGKNFRVIRKREKIVDLVKGE